MPRVKRTKKEREGFLLREFLGELEFRVLSLKLTESPDALATVSKRNQTHRIGIELTDYFNNTTAGTGSPLTPVAAFWELVQDSLVRRISHRKHLTGLDASVTLQTNWVPEPWKDPVRAKQLAKLLAGSLVAFAETHPVEYPTHRHFNSLELQQTPALHPLVSSLRLSCVSKPSRFVSRCNWTCSNISVGFIGLSIDYITSAVRNKNRKALKYDRSNAQELWLVIAAAGDTLSNHAGPFSQSGELVDSQLMSLCQNSPFDRIIFWERIRCWYKWLKPDEPAKQYRNPYVT